MSASSPASIPVIVEQARVRAAEKGVQGWLFALEQPTYVAVMTDADSETLRRDFLRSLVDARLRARPDAPASSTTPR